MKNSQIAILVAAILAAALLVAGTNYYLIRSLSGRARAGHPRLPHAGSPSR